jgi:hypothetical protein
VPAATVALGAPAEQAPDAVADMSVDGGTTGGVQGPVAEVRREGGSVCRALYGHAPASHAPRPSAAGERSVNKSSHTRSRPAGC